MVGQMKTKYAAKGKLIGRKGGKMVGMKTKYASKGGSLKRKRGGKVK